ncbi:MAG: hypothetical protein ABI131_09750 [Nostocoides sp.]
MSPLALARKATRRRVDLLPMTPIEQLRAGRLPLRLAQLIVGLWLYGTASAMFVRATLGLDPWDVFHYGVMRHLHLSLGTIVMIVGALVLLLWIPLRQWPGLGTILNSIVIGIAVDVTLGILPAPDGLVPRWALLLGGILVNGIGGALYIGAQLGPGPRDGLMTGIARRSGRSLRLVRTSLEISVLLVGWLLGGVVGLGTVVYALLIGPCIQLFLPILTVRLDRVEPKSSVEVPRRGPARPNTSTRDDGGARRSAVDGEGERKDTVGAGEEEVASRHGQ